MATAGTDTDDKGRIEERPCIMGGAAIDDVVLGMAAIVTPCVVGILVIGAATGCAAYDIDCAAHLPDPPKPDVIDCAAHLPDPPKW